MRYDISDSVGEQIRKWRREQDKIVADKQKKEGRQGHVPYYGVSGGEITYTFTFGSTTVSASHSLTDAVLKFELLEPPSLWDDDQKKLDEWKQERGHDEFGVRFTPTTLGAVLHLLDLRNGEEKDITEYDGW